MRRSGNCCDGSTHHTGMRYTGTDLPRTNAAPDGAARELREQLRRAIESEQFELAAELRDRLRDRE
jgi:protein-arginine kinase activator protein McsA